jgi:hypothetical protein
MTRVLTYVGVFLVAMATLMLEVLLTRITSVSAWYHLAFFVISLGMLGMTAGAVLVFALPNLFPKEQVPARLAQSAWGFAAATPICVGLSLSTPLAPVTDLMSFFALLGSGGAMAVPFILAGTTLALALTRAGLPASIAYGFDLTGAAAGCVAIIPLLDVLDAPSGALAAGCVGALGATAFAFASERLRKTAVVTAAVLGVLAVANARAPIPPLRPAWVKGVREAPAFFSYLKWNTYSRITVSHSAVQEPMFWARVPNVPPGAIKPFEVRTILIDGAAGTVMVRLGPSLADHSYLAWDQTAFAHRIRPHGAAAVIGVGGGRDVLEAARVGHNPVVGVEINGLIVGLHRQVMAEFSGLTRLPGVQLVYDEARSYFARETREFSVITMSLIDTWASTGAGEPLGKRHLHARSLADLHAAARARRHLHRVALVPPERARRDGAHARAGDGDALRRRRGQAAAAYRVAADVERRDLAREQAAVLDGRRRYDPAAGLRARPQRAPDAAHDAAAPSARGSREAADSRGDVEVDGEPAPRPDAAD